MRGAVRPRLKNNKFLPTLRQLIISPAARKLNTARQIIRRAKKLEIPVITEQTGETIDSSDYSEKRLLYLHSQKKKLINEWKAHPRLPDRSEWCLKPVEGCNFDCHYCYLQNYLERPLPNASVNYQALREQTASLLEQRKNRYFSLGELSDGLFLEPLLKILPEIWELFSDCPESHLEVRTKSGRTATVINNLTRLENVTFTWTLSPLKITRQIELQSASLPTRLEAVKRLQSAGFHCGLRLDPILLTEDWKENYKKLISRCAQKLEIAELDFIILGTFRFPPGLDTIILDRFEQPDFIRSEFVKGPDGKYRYPRPHRTAAYSFLARLLSVY